MSYVNELRALIGQRPLIVPGAVVLIFDGQNRLLLQLVRCQDYFSAWSSR